MNIIQKLFVNGKQSKIGKATLEDDVSNALLPLATSEDAGKVVAVDETGAYELVEDKGSTPLVVTFSGTTDNGDASCDKTWNEIVAASELVLRYSDPHGVISTLTLVDGRGAEVNPSIQGTYQHSGNPSPQGEVIFFNIHVRVSSDGLVIFIYSFKVSAIPTQQ